MQSEGRQGEVRAVLPRAHAWALGAWSAGALAALPDDVPAGEAGGRADTPLPTHLPGQRADPQSRGKTKSQVPAVQLGLVCQHSSCHPAIKYALTDGINSQGNSSPCKALLCFLTMQRRLAPGKAASAKPFDPVSLIQTGTSPSLRVTLVKRGY